MSRASDSEVANTINSHLPANANTHPVLMGYYVDTVRMCGDTPSRINGEVVHACWRKYTEEHRPNHPGLKFRYLQLSPAEKDKDEPFAHAMRLTAHELRGRL